MTQNTLSDQLAHIYHEPTVGNALEDEAMLTPQYNLL